ncbi:MAG: response regulator [Acidimicrobiia bacterium]|nr:response regulator [Acidimicrobiia bacterium]
MPTSPCRILLVAHILIVDDDHVVGETFARMLTLDGHRVTSVQSAQAALDAAGIDPPDAMISTCGCPWSVAWTFSASSAAMPGSVTPRSPS